MGTWLAVIILALLVLALITRGRQKQQSAAEERREESGDWIDKRPGERGTFGTLDREREAERRNVSRQGKITDLVHLVRNQIFENFPGFMELTDEQMRQYTAFIRQQATELMHAAESPDRLSAQGAGADVPADDPFVQSLKKLLLDFSYRNYPALLEQDIERLQALDSLAGKQAVLLTERIRALSA